MKRVSIIVPVFNSRPYLERCLNSILEQSHKLVEVIIVDDGSTDGSYEISRAYERLYSNIVVVRQDNAGPSVARNVAIDRAVGDYVQFVDADDWMHPSMTTALVDIAKHADLAVCGFKRIFISQDGTQCIRSQHSSHSCEFPKHEFLANFGILYNIGLLNSPCNKLYSRELLNVHNIRFDPGVRLGEDLLFNLRYYAICRRIVFTTAPYYYHTIGNKLSLTQRYSGDFFAAQKYLLTAIRDFLQEELHYSIENRTHIERWFAGVVTPALDHACLRAQAMRVKVTSIRTICTDADVIGVMPYVQQGGAHAKLLALLISMRAWLAIGIFFWVKAYCRKCKELAGQVAGSIVPRNKVDQPSEICKE